jgi:hypothetical protein
MSLRSEVIRIVNELLGNSKKITELDNATALTGVELVEVVQGGANKQTTTQDIADLGGGGGGTPTLQQVLTAGSALTGNNTISGGGVLTIESTNGASYKADASLGMELDAFGNMDLQYGALELNGNPGSAGQYIGQGGWGNVTAAQVTNTPAGNISATTVQAAINELDTEITARAPKVIQLAASDESSALTTGTAKITFRMPYAMTLTAVRASLTVPQYSGNILTVDINQSGSSVLSTKITIDNAEETSTTAVVPPVISTSALTDDAEITIDIDQVGDGSAAGLKITLIGT